MAADHSLPDEPVRSLSIEALPHGGVIVRNAETDRALAAFSHVLDATAWIERAIAKPAEDAA